MDSGRPRILLADELLLVLQGLAELLRADPDLEVVALVRTGPDAVAAVTEHRPDVAIVSFSLPGLNGVDTTRRIARDHPEVGVICLSDRVSRQCVTAMLAAGASGYVTVQSGIDDVRRAIDSALAGQLYLSPCITRGVVESLLDGQPLDNASGFSSLTRQQRIVLQMLVEGRTTREIAHRLGVSPKTVGTHRERLMTKLRIHSIAGLTKYAIREGLTSLDS